MIEIDGTFGEGGGQILRTSLALSAVTGQPFRIDDIRRKRSRGGLLRQHLTGVRAATEVCGAATKGVELGSTTLVFEPGDVRAGEYSFEIGSAGSSTLVLQTILPALLQADGPSQVSMSGGTHNRAAPTFEFLRDTFAPMVHRAGPQLDLTLAGHGFYPAGGGQIIADIAPAPLVGFELLERGEIRQRRAHVLVAHLPDHVAERELATVREKLTWAEEQGSFGRVDDTSPGPGNVLTLQLFSEAVTETFVAFGEKGVPAEVVGDQACNEVKAYLASGAPVGGYLADQLVLLFALAGGGRFRTLAPSKHTLTQIEVIPKFLEVDIDCERVEDGQWEISVQS